MKRTTVKRSIFFLCLVFAVGGIIFWHRKADVLSPKGLLAVAERTFPNGRLPPWHKRILLSLPWYLISEGNGLPQVSFLVNDRISTTTERHPEVKRIDLEGANGSVSCMRLWLRSKKEPGQALIQYYYSPQGAAYSCVFSMSVPAGKWPDDFDERIESYMNGIVVRYVNAFQEAQ